MSTTADIQTTERIEAAGHATPAEPASQGGTPDTDGPETGSGPRPTEAYEALHDLARGKCGRIPADLLVRHVLRLYPDTDWVVQRAALEAILRRIDFARRDGLRIAERPKGNGALGVYATRRRGQRARPYRTALEGVDPLVGSCDCPDFVRSSLGVCKHLLAIVDSLAPQPRKMRQAREQPPPELPGPRLTWDPIRPLRGAGDPLERVVLIPGGDHNPDEDDAEDDPLPVSEPALRALAVTGVGGRHRRRRGARTGASSAVERYFGRPSGGIRWLSSTFADKASRRLELVEALHTFLRRRRNNRALDPALERLLETERRRLVRIADAHDALGARTKALRSLRCKLYPYQRDGVKRFLAQGRLLLADDMGLGKTAQAVAACHALWRTEAVARGLLVVPASLKAQWAREWQRFTDAPIRVVDGSPAERHAIYREQREGFLVVNYEQVLRDLDAIHGWNPRVVVLDEAQRIKNWATKTAACIKRLEPEFRLVLTGTPMENRLEELASILDWVDDHALQPKWRLVPWHSMYPEDGKRPVGARNLDTLRQRLAHCLVRRRRPEILAQLPPRTDTVVPVEMSEAQREQHDDLREPIAGLVRVAERRPLTQPEFLRLMTLLTTQRIIANGIAQLHFKQVWPGIAGVRRPDEALLRSLSSPKLLELRELVSRIGVEQQRNIVVFSQWRRMLRLAEWATRDVLADQGLRAAFFTGNEDRKRRADNVAAFHDDPNVRLLLATDAGGVGLNLQRAANCCINLDLPWNPAVLEQRIGRIYRLGQDDPIDVFNLVSERSIEWRIATLVSDKKALFEGLFDGSSDEVRFDEAGGFLEGVQKLVDPADAEPSQAAAPAADAADEDEEAAEADAPPDRALEQIVEAGDESGEQPAQRGGPSEPAAPGSADALPSPDEVRSLLGNVRVSRTEGGGMRIDAPPEAAATLGALFEGVARLLQAPQDNSER